MATDYLLKKCVERFLDVVTVIVTKNGTNLNNKRLNLFKKIIYLSNSLEIIAFIIAYAARGLLLVGEIRTRVIPVFIICVRF
jgi:hypothetical protein